MSPRTALFYEKTKEEDLLYVPPIAISKTWSSKYYRVILFHRRQVYGAFVVPGKEIIEWRWIQLRDHFSCLMPPLVSSRERMLSGLFEAVFSAHPDPLDTFTSDRVRFCDYFEYHPVRLSDFLASFARHFDAGYDNWYLPPVSALSIMKNKHFQHYCPLTKTLSKKVEMRARTVVLNLISVIRRMVSFRMIIPDNDKSARMKSVRAALCYAILMSLPKVVEANNDDMAFISCMRDMHMNNVMLGPTDITKRDIDICHAGTIAVLTSDDVNEDEQRDVPMHFYFRLAHAKKRGNGRDIEHAFARVTPGPESQMWERAVFVVRSLKYEFVGGQSTDYRRYWHMDEATVDKWRVQPSGRIDRQFVVSYFDDYPIEIAGRISDDNARDIVNMDGKLVTISDPVEENTPETPVTLSYNKYNITEVALGYASPKPPLIQNELLMLYKFVGGTAMQDTKIDNLLAIPMKTLILLDRYAFNVAMHTYPGNIDDRVILIRAVLDERRGLSSEPEVASNHVEKVRMQLEAALKDILTQTEYPEKKIRLFFRNLAEFLRMSEANLPKSLNSIPDIETYIENTPEASTWAYEYKKMKTNFINLVRDLGEKPKQWKDKISIESMPHPLVLLLDRHVVVDLRVLFSTWRNNYLCVYELTQGNDETDKTAADIENLAKMKDFRVCNNKYLLRKFAQPGGPFVIDLGWNAQFISSYMTRAVELFENHAIRLVSEDRHADALGEIVDAMESLTFLGDDIAAKRECVQSLADLHSAITYMQSENRGPYAFSGRVTQILTTMDK